MQQRVAGLRDKLAASERNGDGYAERCEMLRAEIVRLEAEAAVATKIEADA